MVICIASTKKPLGVAEQRQFELKFDPQGFIVTHEHVLFEDVCEDVRRYRYVALCVGGAGVGKTHSGRRYSSWDLVEPLSSRYTHILDPPPEIASRRAAYFSAPPASTQKMIRASTQKMIRSQVESSRNLLSWLVDVSLSDDDTDASQVLRDVEDRTELLIVDEAQFLKNDALEQLRYEYDRNNFGLILMGMPGLNKILARYKQFHSRIGQVYKFKPLGPDSVIHVLSRPELLGTSLGAQAFPEEVLPAIMNATQGNFRKLKMLVQRVERILEINHMEVATSHLV